MKGLLETRAQKRAKIDQQRAEVGLGLDDEAVLEIMSVVDLFSGYNKLMDGLQVEPDEKPWYG
jgi:alkylhydroperoxidase family enzyme